MGCRAVPIKMDAASMSADDLERKLSEWDVTHPGIKDHTCESSILVEVQ